MTTKKFKCICGTPFDDEATLHSHIAIMDGVLGIKHGTVN